MADADFETLRQMLADTAVLAKAHAEPDGDEDEPEYPEDDDELDDDDGGEPLTKSFRANVDGEDADIVDAEALIKSITAQVAREQAGEFNLLKKSLADVAELLGGIVPLVKAQAEAINDKETRLAKAETMLAKALSDLEAIGNTGRGRKAVLNIHEHPGAATLQKAESGPTQEDVMAKAHAAFDKGVINGNQLNGLDAAYRMGQPRDAAVLRKIL